MNSMSAPKFYVASRASIPERSQMWRAIRDGGVDIVSTWIDEAGAGETDDFGELWARIESEIRSADCLVLYVEAGDFPLKGALVEVGMALAMDKPVRIVEIMCKLDPRDFKPLGSWAKHPKVTMYKDLRQALIMPVTQAAPVSPRLQSAQDVIQEVIKSVPSDGSLGKFLKDKLAVLEESFDTERRLTDLAGRVLEFMSHEYGEHLAGERPDVEELIALAQAALDSVTLTPPSKEKS